MEFESPLAELFERVQERADLDITSLVSRAVKRRGKLKYSKYVKATKTTIESVSYLEMDFKTLSKKVKK